MSTFTAVAHPNIAFIKYWGNIDQSLRIPVNGSISMNLAGLQTTTRVTFDSGLDADQLTLNQQPVTGPGLSRVSEMVNRIRAMAGKNWFADVVSENNFPTGTGIASSASAFAALAVAGSAAAGLSLDEPALSALARTGSGSASRSVPGGYVEWKQGAGHENSYAFSIAPPEHWDLADCVAIVSKTHKPTGSTQGHALAPTSPLQAARVADADRRLTIVRDAILRRDFEAFAEIVELDSNLMHAVMMTSEPRLLYWDAATVLVIQEVGVWRSEGIPVCYTIDAGPNVHVICEQQAVEVVRERLGEIPGVQTVLTASPGGSARLVD